MSTWFELVLVRAAGKPALWRALPVYAGLGIFAGIIFGQNGMHPADVTSSAAHSAGFRLALWAGWLIGLVPAAAILFRNRELDYLRWLPVARWRFWIVLGSMLLALQAPWAALWLIGSGTREALAAALLAAGLHALAAVTPRSRAEAAARLGLVAGVAALLWLASPGAAEVVLCAGAALVALGVPAAWARAPERAGPRSPRPLLPQAVLALAQCYVRGVVRTRASVLTRGLVAIALGAGLAVQMAMVNHLHGAGAAQLAHLSGLIAAVSLAIATGSLAAPMLETERSLGWLLDSMAVPADTRALARLLAAASLGVPAGMLHGVLTAWGTAPGPDGATGAARLVAGAALLGLAMALFAMRAARWSARARRGKPGGNIDGTGVVVAMLGAVALALVAIGVLGDAATLALATLAVATSWDR